MEAKIIEHKNQKIVYVDYRGAKTEEEILDLLNQRFKLSDNIGYVTNTLINCSGVDIFTKRYVEALKGAFQNPQGKVAVVGVTGVTKTIKQGIDTFIHNKNTKLFDTEEEAKEWLAS